MKKILALVLSLIMVLSLTACGSSDVSGKYLLTSMKSEEMEIKKGDDNWNAIFAEADSVFSIELKADGKCELFLMDEKTEANYEVSGDKITFTADGEDDKFEGTIKDGKLTLSIDTEEMVFEKQ